MGTTPILGEGGAFGVNGICLFLLKIVWRDGRFDHAFVFFKVHSIKIRCVTLPPGVSIFKK